MPGADRGTEKNQAVVVVDEPACPAACRRRGALPEWAPSVSINNPCAAPYRPCAGQANFLGNESAARRPMRVHMWIIRTPVTATYRAVGPGIHGRCVGAMELHSRHPVKGGMIAAFRVRPRPRGSQAAWRSAGSRRGGRQRHAGQAPLARGGGPFGERRRSGDAARSRCSKQATASNASVISRQACCAIIFLRISRFTSVAVVPTRLRRLPSLQHSFGLVRARCSDGMPIALA
jgi:hypothetical protein